VALASRVGLLDVNVLVALFDPDHVHHEVAHDWFARHREHGWATCPLTENGFVRIVSNPAYGFEGLRADAALTLLKTFLGTGGHAFWRDALSLTDERLFDLTLATGHRQVTDIYLLGLATAREGCLVTFDRSIPRAAVKGAGPEALCLIAPTD
jgi:toxin-antitoxin system PIN domain toxin